MLNTACISNEDITSIVIDECQATQTTASSCTFQPTHIKFNGDPCVGTYKYLRVAYSCQPGLLFTIYSRGYQDVELFGSRSWFTFCWTWPGCKLLAKVISSLQIVLHSTIQSTDNTMHDSRWMFTNENEILCI